MLMLKFIMTKDIKYNGKLYRGRKIIGTEETLALIYPLRDKAIFTHGWRSEAQQKEMVDKGVSKTMDSNHCRGVAYDIWNWSEMEKEMRKLGFKNEISWDKGHFPFEGEYKARLSYKIIPELPKKLEEYKPKKEAIKSPIPEKVSKMVQVLQDAGEIPPQVKIEPITPIHEVLAESVGISKQEMTEIVNPSPDLAKVKSEPIEITAITEIRDLIILILKFLKIMK